MTRLAARLICAAIVAACLLVAGPMGSASALCEGDITPVRPDGTPVGWFVSPPQVGTHPNSSGSGQVADDYPSGDPFTDRKVSWSDTYGYGAHWNTYDLGCGPDAARAPLAGPFTAFGNLMLEVAKFPVAVLSQVQQWLTSDPFSWLDPVTATISHRIEHNVWLKLFPLSMIMLGLVFVWQSRRADFNATLSATGWALIVLTLSLFFLHYPQKANSMMTSAITSGSAVASSPFSNGSFADEVSKHIIYPQWLQGELGSSTSAVAQKYGQELYASQHLTWNEAQKVDRAGDAGSPIPHLGPQPTPAQRRDAQIPEQKDQDFKSVAEKVKEADPTAYQNLQGLHGENRLAAAFIMSVYTWTASAFMFLALAFLALALLMVRAVVIAAPIAAIVGLHDRYRHALKGILNMFVASLVAVIKFTLAAGVFSVVVSGIIEASTNQALKLLLVLVSTVVALMVVKPVRTLKTVIPGADPATSYAKQALGYVLNRKAVEDGVEDGLAHSGSRTGPSLEVRSTRAEEESLDPIPASTPTPGRYRIFADDPLSSGEPMSLAYGAAPANRAGEPYLVQAHESAGADGLGRAPVWLADAGPRHAAVTAGGTATDARGDHRLAGSDRSLMGSLRSVDAEYGDIYSRSRDASEVESTVLDDLPVADKQVDADGKEVFVVYRTRDDADQPYPRSPGAQQPVRT
jgi:hypothetical protein